MAKKSNKSHIQRSKELMDIGLAHATAPLVKAWLYAALGEIKVFEKVGTEYIRVVDDEMLSAAFKQIDIGGKSADGRFYFVSAKDPDANAIDKIFTRLHGKPKDDAEDATQNIAKFLQDLAIKALEIRNRKTIETSATSTTDVRQTEDAV